MRIHLKVITLDESAAGAILAQDVYKANGTLLLKKGSILSQDCIDSLLEMGFSEVQVNADDLNNHQKHYTSEEITKIKEACFDDLMQRFPESPKEEMMEALFAAILEDMVMRKVS